MTEDQKAPTVQRNYIGNHKQRRINDEESMDEQEDSSIDSSDLQDAIESTHEIKKREPNISVKKGIS